MARKPIYAHDLPAGAWKLLWWLICKMDETGEVKGGWRIAASQQIHADRHWIGRCAEMLQNRHLIETAAGRRWARVKVENIVG